MFLSGAQKRNWNEQLGVYVAAVLGFLHKRPECFPTLQGFRPRNKSDMRIRNLLALERRRTRKVHDLLDKLTETVEKRQLKQADIINIEVSDTLMEIFDIWLKLNKRFRL